MRVAVLTDAQLDALVIAAHRLMDGRLPAEEEALLEQAVRELRQAPLVDDATNLAAMRLPQRAA